MPAFTAQLMEGEPLTIHGDGSQTRSIADVDDIVEALVRLLHHHGRGPVNVGNPQEHTVLEIAGWVAAALGVDAPRFRFVPAMEGDPRRRCPDIERARRWLDWTPTVSAHDAVQRAARWLAERSEPAEALP